VVLVCSYCAGSAKNEVQLLNVKKFLDTPFVLCYPEHYPLVWHICNARGDTVKSLTVWREPAVFFWPAPSAAESRQRRIGFKQQEEDMFTGTVKWFNEAKGYGFIRRDDGPDLFVHYTNIVGSGFRTLKEDDKVEFEVNEGPKGLQAVKVAKV
jgi:cold shock protein